MKLKPLRAVAETAERLPLTEAGWAVVAATLTTFFLAWLLGWLELGIIAAGGAIALVIGLLFVIRRYRLDITRTLEPAKVTVGEPAFGLVRVTNTRSTPSASMSIEDKVGVAIVPIDLPVLAPGRSHEALYQLPTHRRGVVDVGPLSIGRSDPLRLYRSEVRHTGTDRLWVHPRYEILHPLPAGFAKDFEGPTSETSPKGDVTFHALREYVFGDDYRHIHWRSSARLGTLMVRHYVDNRQPQTAVVIDPALTDYASGDYELAVSIAASVGVSSIASGHPVVICNGSDLISGAPLGSNIEDVLDSLALIDPEDRGFDAIDVASALQKAKGSSVLVVITGAISPERVMALTARVATKTRVIVVRAIGDDECDGRFVPRIKLVNSPNLEHFKGSWNQIAR